MDRRKNNLMDFKASSGLDYYDYLSHKRAKKVWTNGCFDIIHRGHIELFTYAKSLGTHLTVGVDSDERVKELKGMSRPTNKLCDRILVLEAIEYIDEVVVFDSENDLVELVRGYRPDYLVVGSDYKDKKVVGREYAKEVKFFERIEGYSSSKYINAS
jgi:rfaE bifunctional protein nucleotidyltransferase chain/domain